jgi:hyperosmotically inducible periplasmic protein
MRVRRVFAALALGGLVMLPSSALAQAGTAAKVDDGALKARIETRLQSAASLKDDTITVAVQNGVVTLTGKVDSKGESQHAAQLAHVKGVTNVENKLDVEGKTEKTAEKAAATTGKTMEKAGEKTKDAAVKTGEKTKEGAAKVGEKTKEAAATTGEVIDDAWITTKIKTDFVNEDALKGSDINVDTNNHVVTLKGTVASLAGKSRAEQIAKTTKGVHRVIDQLTIAPKK